MKTFPRHSYPVSGWFRWLSCLGIAGWLGCSGLGNEPEVRNVRAAQRAGTTLVDVHYDVVHPAGLVTVTVMVSEDAGRSYAPVTHLTGEVGTGVAPGVERHVVWNAGADRPNFVSETMRVSVNAQRGEGFPTGGFALIPAGSFEMGDNFNEGWDMERPVHTVFVSAFYMGRMEVTRAEWDEVRAWAEYNGYNDLGSRGGKAANHPVHSVSWYDVMKWCNAASEREGLVPVYRLSDGSVYRRGRSDPTINYESNGYRLPSEAEWEKAARGGVNGQRFPWGNTISHSQANYFSSLEHSFDVSSTYGFHSEYKIGEVPYTSPVGSFAPNGYGLYDMAGNVSEWCNDWYDEHYYGSSPLSDPQGPITGVSRVNRGGSWGSDAFRCRSTFRSGNIAISRYDSLGFRLARSSVP